MEAPSHSWAYLFRRGLNWVPLGFAYAFFYMGRYNLTVAKRSLGEDIMSNMDFGAIFGIGALVYGISFLFTGPLTDKMGGRCAMLLGAAGTILANFLMGLTLYGMTYWGWTFSVPLAFGILYALNMHFQSYGAIAIVTVKAPWFHIRERGRFSTIFGWMISLGIFFAFDWGGAIAKATRAVLPENLGFWATTFQTILGSGGTGVDQNWWLFFFPSILIGICWILMFFWLKNSPGEAGYKDFDTGEGSVSSSGERLPISQVYLKIITHPILLIVCLIEFCSGILRNGIMHWYYIFAGKTGKETWITDNWGLSLLIAGFTGALLTGWCSDRFFQSRRAPMAAILYIVMLLSTLLMTFTLDLNPWYAGGAALAISMAVIGVHGILSGTSTADFAGTKNAGAATGIVDGMVYLGTGIQSFIIPLLIPSGDSEEAKVAFNYQWWPVFLIPFAIIGAGLCIKIWNALPKAKPKAA